jgi:hypothetical protein
MNNEGTVTISIERFKELEKAENSIIQIQEEKNKMYKNYKDKIEKMADDIIKKDKYILITKTYKIVCGRFSFEDETYDSIEIEVKNYDDIKKIISFNDDLIKKYKKEIEYLKTLWWKRLFKNKKKGVKKCIISKK